MCTSMMAPTICKNFQSPFEPQSMYVILALYYSYGALPILMRDDDGAASPRHVYLGYNH